MLRHRLLLLAAVYLVVAGALGTTLGYGLYLRSDSYRERLSETVSEYLRLPTEIDSVVPLTLSSRRCTDVRVWLPDRRDQVFQCEKAVWRDDPGGVDGGCVLELQDGTFTIGMERWTPGDYQHVLKSSLEHDFRLWELDRVDLSRIDIAVMRPDFCLTAQGVAGQVQFESDNRGNATLICFSLNDQETVEPIHIFARFNPSGGITFSELRLKVPEMPLSALGLEQLLSSNVTSGRFAGSIVYRESSGSNVVEIEGSLEELQLREVTKRLIGGPFRGTVRVFLDEARFIDGELDGLRFRGRVEGLRLGDVAPELKAPGLDGLINLTVYQAEIDQGGIRYLSACGEATDLSLEVLTRKIGYGIVTGRLRVRINSLEIIDDEIQSSDIDVIAIPPDDGPATIERELVHEVVKRWLGISLPDFLPETISYTRFGARILTNGPEMQVKGLYGDDGRTILTISIADAELDIIRQPARTFQIGDPIAYVRGLLSGYDYYQFRDWWEEYRSEDGPGNQQY